MPAAQIYLAKVQKMVVVTEPYSNWQHKAAVIKASDDFIASMVACNSGMHAHKRGEGPAKCDCGCVCAGCPSAGPGGASGSG